MDVSHNKLAQEGKLKCLSKLQNLENLDISENEIYTLNYLKLSKFLKRCSQNLKILYFKQIGQTSEDLIPNKKAAVKFSLECPNLADWDFKEKLKKPVEEVKIEKSDLEKHLSRRKSQPIFNKKNLEIQGKSAQKPKKQEEHSKKFLNKRERRKSQVLLQKQQKVPENLYSTTPTKCKGKWITKSPGKPLRDITNQEEDQRRTRTISKLLTRVIRKTTRKTTRKKEVTEFSEVKKNLKNFYKRFSAKGPKFTSDDDSDDSTSRPLIQNPFGEVENNEKRKYTIEDFEDMEVTSPERNSKVRSSTPNFWEKTNIDENFIRNSIAFRLGSVGGEFERKLKSLKSICNLNTSPGDMIPEENISKNQLISPSIAFQDGGISFGIQPQKKHLDALEFKKMI